MMRTYPHSVDAEKAVLGALLFACERVYPQVASLLSDDDFYSRAHVAIWQTIQRLANQGKPVDFATVGEAMRASREMGHLAAFNSEAYLVELSTSIASLENIGFFAETLHDKSQVRRLIKAGEAIAQKGYEGELGPQELLDFAQASTHGIGRRDGLARRWLYDSAEEAVERQRAIGQRGTSLTGVPSGFWLMDDMSAGWQPADLIIVAARPSMGKTAFALDCAMNAAQRGYPVLLFSLEMSGCQLAMRALSRVSGVGLGRIRRGLRGSDLHAVQSRLQNLHVPIEIADWSAPTVARMRAEARSWRIWHRDHLRREQQPDRPGLIICDYLQLIGGTGEPRRKGQEYSQEREIADISRALKGLAKELDVPVIALAQLNRQLELRPKTDRRPRNSDLRGSGAIEQDADVICFLYCDEVYNSKTPHKGIAEVIIGKQRQGETGKVRLRFVAEQARFEDETPPSPPTQEELSYA